MDIIRDDKNKWILQKNINSKDLFIDYLSAIKHNKNQVNFSNILSTTKNVYSYIGRSAEGSANTMGVRMSEINFYMFGYRSTFSKEFVFSPISEELLLERIEESKLFLANIFMMQYPHPNSKTSPNVDLFFGRLILKLLMDKRLNNKLYSDELVYILPFVTKIDQSIYEELVLEILKYRKLDFSTKKNLFESVPNYVALFAKTTHEMLYYFVRICQQFGVLNVTEDLTHNDGEIFKFQQGKTKTFRRTSILSGGKFQGFVSINPTLVDLVHNLLTNFPFDAETYKLGRNGIITQEDLFNDMFILQSYQLLGQIAPQYYIHNEISDKLEDMRKTSINSRDGKSFEKSLEVLFKEFDESYSVNLLSGAGKTDLFCVFLINGELQPFNVEAKSGSAGDNVNVMRIMRHMEQTNADYCLMVAPRFSFGTYLDIESTKISTITTESLYQYCMRMLTKSNYKNMPYSFINELALNNPGKRIDYLVEDLINQNIFYE